MQTREWRWIDHAEWGDGPWQNECDKRQWEDPATGLPCLIVRHERSGHWCAYVGVGVEHPLYGRAYSECTLFQKPCADTFCDHRLEFLLDVHGGITFSGPCQEQEHGICHLPDAGEEDNLWWFGCDFAHSGDLSPGLAARLRQRGGSLAEELAACGYSEMYRTQAYAHQECQRLAEQLYDSEQWRSRLEDFQNERVTLSS